MSIASVIKIVLLITVACLTSCKNSEPSKHDESNPIIKNVQSESSIEPQSVNSDNSILILKDEDFTFQEEVGKGYFVLQQKKELSFDRVRKLKTIKVISDQLAAISFNERDSYINPVNTDGEIVNPFWPLPPAAPVIRVGNEVIITTDGTEISKWMKIATEHFSSHLPGTGKFMLRILLTDSTAPTNPVNAVLFIPFAYNQF